MPFDSSIRRHAQAVLAVTADGWGIAAAAAAAGRPAAALRSLAPLPWRMGLQHDGTPDPAALARRGRPEPGRGARALARTP